MRRIFQMVAFASAFLFFQSCSTKEVLTPVTANADLQTNSIDASAMAAARTTPAPGNYTVTKYIDEGTVSTRIFRGYVFTFKANGIVTAKVGTTTYPGTWVMEDNGTKMDIDIEGTDALKEVDRNWDVVALTNTKISLNNDGGEHVLVFTRQQ